MMDSDEREIYRYLKSQPGVSLSINLIARYACGKRRFQEEPSWAGNVLKRMEERGIIEIDSAGSYQLKPVPRGDGGNPVWMSPQVAEILRRSVKSFPDAGHSGDDESYYDSL